MTRGHRDCLVFPMPALPPGFVIPAPAPTPTQLSAQPRPAPGPLPEPYRSRRPCRAIPAISLDQLRALNA